MEDTTQSIIPDREKIGKLNECIRDYTAFAHSVNDMTRTAKHPKPSLLFADDMEELTTKSDHLKEVQLVKSTNASDKCGSGQNGCRIGHDDGG